MSVEEIRDHEDIDLEGLLDCSLPTSRVKKICRLDPDLGMIGSDAILFMTKATELFAKELARASYTQAVLEKRKTIQTKDLEKAIASKHMFEFLDDTLSDWPEAETSRIVSQTNHHVEETIPEEEGIVDDDTEEVLEGDLEEGENEAALSESIMESVDELDSSQAEASPK